ncbi:MAG TPA: tol-pal system protein YbgF [Desulfonatronum sp.]|nr:tol-pal system protein YbgF [Desulfonatronum sp.]
MFRICVLLSLILLITSCIATTGEMNALSSRVWEQEERQRRMQGQLTALDQELGRILSDLEGLSTPMRATQANLWAEIEGLRTQTAVIQGQMEELQRALRSEGDDQGGAMIADLSRQVSYLDRSVAMIASQLSLDLGPRPLPQAHGLEVQTEPALTGEPRAHPQNAFGPEDVDDPAQALYDGALQAFHSRDYARARSMWDEFVRTFPQHELVSNALFWQGESFFQMEDYAQAVLAYQDVISKHPASNKYAAAMLKQGVSFFRLNKDRAGVLVLEDLIKRFPSLPEATRAKTILDEQKKP